MVDSPLAQAEARILALEAEVDKREKECVAWLATFDSSRQREKELRQTLWILRQERDGLKAALEKADALEESIEHARDLREVADFLRDRMEELRQHVEEPWRLHVDDFSASVRELANRKTAFDSLYACTEYANQLGMIEDAAKAYKEVRHAR